MKKPRLITLVAFFTQLRLAYDIVRPQMQQLQQDASASNGLQLSTAVQDQIKTWFRFLNAFYQGFVPAPLLWFVVDLVTQKVQDYGALLKLGKFQLSFKALQQLWLVFLCLAPESMYCRGVLLYLLQLEHWKTYWRNPFTMLKNHFSSFIEEDGELSFSVLSRTVLQDSHKSSFDTLNNAFKAQRLHLQAAASLLEVMDWVVFTRSTHTFFNHGDVEVQLLKEFLL